jgi:hypothetical protein
MLAVADLVERERYGFHMRNWQRNGWPCCIAGYAAWESLADVSEYERRILMQETSVKDRATKYFGLVPVDEGGQIARRLFMPVFEDIFPDDDWRKHPTYAEATLYARDQITPQWAAATMRTLVASGSVDWQAYRRKSWSQRIMYAFAEAAA